MAEKTRSGFVEGKCPKCGKIRFSKGNTHKHKCKGEGKK